MIRGLETFEYEWLQSMALDYPKRHAFIFQSTVRRATLGNEDTVFRYAKREKEDPTDHRTWVACFKVRPRFTRFLDFQKDRKVMDVEEFTRTFGGLDVYDFTNTADVLVYVEGLFIERLKDNRYSLFIENDDWITDNLLELELRLFAWHINFLQTDHTFNDLDHGTDNLNWYIKLARFERAAKDLYIPWVDSNLSEGVLSLSAADYPWDGSFDDHYYRIRKWLETQLTLI